MLNREEIARLISGGHPLIAGYVALESQLQPNGFDLTVGEVGRLATPGRIGASDDGRLLASVEPLPYDADGWLSLAPGPYLITFTEIPEEKPLPADMQDFMHY